MVAIILVDEDDDLMLMADSGKIIRTPVRAIKVISRNTQGVKLIGMESNERVTGAARLAEKEEDEEQPPLLPDSSEMSTDNSELE